MYIFSGGWGDMGGLLYIFSGRALVLAAFGGLLRDSPVGYSMLYERGESRCRMIFLIFLGLWGYGPAHAVQGPWQRPKAKATENGRQRCPTL